MGTIVNTMIQGLTEQMVQARLNSADASGCLCGKHFPVKKVNGFNWKTLTNQLEKKNVAADLHTDNGTIMRKRRPIFESARGDIPFISISRELSRSEIRLLTINNGTKSSRMHPSRVLTFQNRGDFIITSPL